ncbi:unnamed protein product [Rotaria sordida]|uniref:Uncharacterized protein n=1 Tax=Rotaria sordida TaxID=392033 RepID=A0A814SPG6_9BILA|nr:unnamed protein product [Rotaria sordida]CAF3543537.1 unnamed protein product [Rotaria sordida]
MNSIITEWKKQSSDELNFLPDRQYFQQDSIEKINNQISKSNKKKVRFNCQTPNITEQPFEYTKNNHSEIIQSEKLTFNDHDSRLSTNILTGKLSSICNNSKCSVRTRVIIFIIIILILIITAIVITFSIIQSTQNTTVTSIENTNQSSFSTIFTTMMVSSVSIGNQSGAPCSSYTTINDPTRNIAQILSSGSCDNGPLFNSSSGEGAWIRFVGNGGTIIPFSSPGRNHCGAYSSGWFNGTLPKTFDTIVNGFICLSSDIGECIVTYNSSVIYCIGSFYVYFLLPVPICNARYCTT